jgi:hypothetical protein
MIIMENKQTAVDFFMDSLAKSYSNDFLKIYEQAKAMEKEQIEDAFQAGKWDWNQHITKAEVSKDLAQYYNETYGSKRKSRRVV